MLQRLPIALVQVKAGNNSENLLNVIRKIVYSLYQSKGITKKDYITTKLSQYKYKNGHQFMSSENSKTSEPNVLILKHTNELDLRRDEKSIALSNIKIYHGKT